MTSLIYGYGDTGKSFERYLEDKKIDFKIFDSNITEYNLNYNFLDFDKILCSPGVPKDIFENIKSQNINTCLLYTSPSPRDLSTSRMPSSA